MSTQLSEREQFELFREGSKAACSYFFMRHNEGVYNYVRTMAPDAGMAKALSEDVFKRAWDLRGNIGSAQQLAVYIYVIARHLFLAELRRLNMSPGNLEECTNSELEIVCHRVLAELTMAMKRLSAKRKLVLRLLYVKELDINTVAQQLKLSPQTVRNHKAQATAKLREKLFDRELVMPLSLSILLRYIEEQ